MIDFANASYLKLRSVANSTYENAVSTFLVPGENIVATFQSIRDGEETAGTSDLDSEMELWFSGMGRVKLEFTRSTDITVLCRLISGFALK